MAKNHADFLNKFIPIDQRAAVKRRSDAIVIGQVLRMMREAGSRDLKRRVAGAVGLTPITLPAGVMTRSGPVHGRVAADRPVIMQSSPVQAALQGTGTGRPDASAVQTEAGEPDEGRADVERGNPERIAHHAAMAALREGGQFEGYTA